MDLNIYPEIWDEGENGEQSLEYLLDYFKEIKIFYAKAASSNHGMINFIN